MSQILITWREINDGDFPNYCMSCGRHGAELVPRTLQTIHHRIVYRLRRWIKVDLPFCEAHRSRPLIAWGRMDAAQFTDEGVWLKNVAPEFIDALWEHRDRVERRRKRILRVVRGEANPERPERVEVVEEDDREDERTRQPRRGDPKYERPASWVAPLLIILAACFLLVLFCGLFAVNLVISGPRNPGPVPGPRPGQPFGPIGPIGPPIGPRR